MTKREKQLYKSGRKNKNAYHFSPFSFKQKCIISFAIILTIFSCFISILNKLDIVRWGDVKSYAGAIDGIRPANSDFTVYYLDVGQSDCTIVVCNDEVLMIDCGTYNQRNVIRQSLVSLNIDTIDYMIITHQHDDHFGSATKILNNWQVKNFIMPRLSQENMVTSKAYNDLLYTVKQNNVNTIASKVGYQFKLGEATVELLSPTEQNANLNNMSVVLKITYGETSFLFQGDAEKEIETDLLRTDYDLDVDVLKIGHHGSNTSSTEKYLDRVNPKYAIISAGSDNSYSHPHGQVLKRLEDNNIKPYITSYNGNIVAISDGNDVEVITEFTNGQYYNTYS